MSIPIVSLPGNKPGELPVVGLGTWKAPAGVVTNVVQEALRQGYRAIDCACDYGNEHEVGVGIQTAIQEGTCTRDDIFVTSKLWNTYHKAENVRPALEKTLADLRLDYIDLYMIHFPISLKYVPISKRYPPEWVHDPSDPEQNKLILENAPLAETWAALEKLVDEGMIRHLGVCNFPVALLADLVSYARIRPVMLQVELHPYLQQPLLLEYCRREGIAVTAFSSLGAASYVALGMDGGDDLLKDGVLCEIGAKLGRSSAQIALRWAVQRGTIVIPKTSRVERLGENMDLFSFELSEADMQAIGKLDKGRRYNDPGVFCVGMGMSIPIYN